jgi:DNA-binding CsgD family transcriptional regulator
VSTLGPDQVFALAKKIPGVVYQFVVRNDRSWHISYISEQVVDLYGVTPEAVYRDHRVLARLIFSEDWDAYRASVEKSIVSMTLWQHLYRIRTPLGRARWIMGHAMPEPSDDGAVVWRGVLTDMSNFIEMESQFFGLLMVYESALKSRQHQLNKETEIMNQIRAKAGGSHVDPVPRERAPSMSDSAGPEGCKRQEYFEHQNFMNRVGKLTGREEEVFGHVVRGSSSRAIAEDLKVSLATVHAHRRNIRKKIGVITPVEMFKYAMMKFPVS